MNGLLYTDEDFLGKKRVTDFSKCSVVPGRKPRKSCLRSFPVLEVVEQDV